MSDKPKTLDDVVRGDKVVRIYGYGSDNKSIETVTGTTPTLIRIGGSKYLRKNGYHSPREHGWSSSRIELPTGDLVKAIELQNLRAFIRRVLPEQYDKLPVEAMREIKRIATKALQEELTQ